MHSIRGMEVFLILSCLEKFYNVQGAYTALFRIHGVIIQVFTCVLLREAHGLHEGILTVIFSTNVRYARK